MSIKLKLILIITFVIFLTGLSMGGYIYWQNDKVFSNHINDDINSTIGQTAQLINFYINRSESSLTNLASDPLTLEALVSKDPANYAKLSDKMTVIKSTLDTIENISLIEINGTNCVARAANQSASSVLGKDFSGRDHCQGIIKTKSTYLSSAYLSTVSNNPVLGLAIPVKNTKGEILGYIYGSINLIELRGYLWDLQQGQDSKVELLDRYGVMFLNTEEKIETLNNLPIEEQAELNEIASKVTESKKIGHIRDVDDFIGFLPSDSYTLIYEKSAESLLAFSQSLNLTFFFALIGTIILIITIIYVFVGRITKRISRLSRIAQDIASGKFNNKLSETELTAKDETAVLARSFNEMANKLDDLYKNLDIKVKEKTKKLEQSEKELKKNLVESEKMNKLMVGRELEMLRLKKEINELKKNK